MRKGERVLLSEVAAGRDPSAFPAADEFVIDRTPNLHLSFGVGIHRCPGSHLARMEFEEMISAVLRRLPDYHIAPEAIVEYPDWAMVGGWQAPPATFTPTNRIVADRTDPRALRP
jgi:cytochrome P450